MKAELRRQERELAEMEQQRNAEAAAAQAAAAQAEAAAAAEPQGEPSSRQKGPSLGKGVSPLCFCLVVPCMGDIPVT